MSAPTLAAASPYILERIKEQGLRRSTLRNGGVGFLIGSCLLALKVNKLRKNRQELVKLKEIWSSYLMKYPVFLAVFTLIYKVE